ncbi:MAG: nicotinamide mononucleotide transporter [Bacteroidales bacterium]|nr:nicotinamide mononucleotide transporter [Bacteroidales bacterium]
MSWVEIVSALLGLSCVFLAGRGSKYNFWVGYAYNIFLFILFWNQHLYSAMILQPVSFAINLYGHWRWTHPKEEERSAADATALKVGSLGPKGWVASIAVVAIAGALWALCLQWLPQRWPDVFGADPSPWLDSYVLMVTLLAQFLSARKCWECWIVWLVVNCANIALYIVSGLYLMPLVSALYLANGIWSLVSWRKKLSREE